MIKGTKHKKSAKIAIAAANRGKIKSDEVRLQISKGLIGIKLSQDHKNNIQKGIIKWWDKRKKKLGNG